MPAGGFSASRSSRTRSRCRSRRRGPCAFRTSQARALAVIAVLAVIGVLVRFRIRHLLLPAILILLALLVIAIDDASFIGGVRPFDGGDDGLFYDGVGRLILQKLLAGDIAGFLEGGEKVFYYGGPGLRYFRALEHIVFGETYLGYLSLILMLPFIALGLFRRFLPERWSLVLILLFIAVPFGVLFGTSFLQYAEMGVAGICRPGGVHFLLLCNSPAHRPNVFRPRKGWCYCVLWRASACFGDIHEADRGTRRRCLAWRRRACCTLWAAMDATCWHVHRLPAGILDGLAQLGVWPCLCSVQLQFARVQCSGNAAVGLWNRFAPVIESGLYRCRDAC